MRRSNQDFFFDLSTSVRSFSIFFSILSLSSACGIKIEVAGVGLDGVALQSLFFLGFAEKAKGNRVAGFGQRGVLKAIDGGVDVAFVQ